MRSSSLVSGTRDQSRGRAFSITSGNSESRWGAKPRSVDQHYTRGSGEGRAIPQALRGYDGFEHHECQDQAGCEEREGSDVQLRANG